MIRFDGSTVMRFANETDAPPQWMVVSMGADTSDALNYEACSHEAVDYWHRLHTRGIDAGAASALHWPAAAEEAFVDGPRWVTSATPTWNLHVMSEAGFKGVRQTDDVERAKTLVYAWERGGHGKLASLYVVFFVEQSFRSRNLAQVNQLLADASVEYLTEWSMIALLRSSFSAKAALPAWSRFLANVRQALLQRGQDPNRLLRGLSK